MTNLNPTLRCSTSCAWLFNSSAFQTTTVLAHRLANTHAVYTPVGSHYYLWLLLLAEGMSVLVKSRGSFLVLSPHPSYLDPFLYFHTQVFWAGEDSQPLSLHVFKVHELKIPQKFSCTFNHLPWIQEDCLLSCRNPAAGNAKKLLSLFSPLFWWYISQLSCISGEAL